MKPLVSELHQEKLNVTDEMKAELATWLEQEIAAGVASRAPQDELWRELMRLYEGVPKKEIRNTPIVNAPNIEVTIGAIACDSTFAQVIDLIFGVSPILTVRAANKDHAEDAKPFQRFVDWIAANEIDLRRGAEQSILDDIQMGTGVLYCPWIEKSKKTKVRKITDAHPVVRAVAPEDFLVPGGADEELQEARWVAMRYYLNDIEVNERERFSNWDVSGLQPFPNMSWVKSRREQLGRTMSSDKTASGRLYSFWDVYMNYDIDKDGIAEDLLVTFHDTGRRICAVRYNPYDRRPFEAMRYQVRPHLFYGIGVMEMMKPYQEGVTELYNEWVTNLKIANSRIWKAKEGAIPATMEIWPNKVISLPDPTTDLIPEQLGDTYPSAPQALTMTAGLAQQRVGVNELSGDRPSALLGSRTPGITALTAVQQINKRFTPPFDGIRLAVAASVRQCLYRYQERVLAGDERVISKINDLMGDEAQAVIDILSNPEFDQQMVVELTASSASVNKDADKQNLIMLATQILAPYYQRCIELTAMASNPQTPPPVQEVILKVAKAMSEGIDLIIRTFDQVRDPRLLAVALDDLMTGMTNQLNPMQALMAQMGPEAMAQTGMTAGGGPAPMGMSSVPAQPPQEANPMAELGAPPNVRR